MGHLSMPGDWAMSMWMRMPGQSWLDAAASFLAMWVVMMVAMMQPALVPMLWRYRKTAARVGATRLGWLTALVGLGYFFVWTLVGMVAFPAGAALAALEMQVPVLLRAVPLAGGFIMLIAGALQFTRWKAYRLACCRRELTCSQGSGTDAGSAWAYGLRLGLQCCSCCGNLMVVPLIVGIMDLPAMAVVTIAIALERIAPGGVRVAQAIGAVVVGSGLFLIARAGALL